eukprot:CAMPEP_0179213868 /NCGR_PEP_ID=MMETSP0797-20121207/1939_1 /TAXON_ID=47934 /ORGANISM="Dinophysis acuminata, Strain DAEP01" /LENGTH=447 /DNA_ID=CAMNT_0020919717 /DNA_START=6 /DNA_END=1346 /DNA_ORIENTATION=-
MIERHRRLAFFAASFYHCRCLTPVQPGLDGGARSSVMQVPDPLPAADDGEMRKMSVSGAGDPGYIRSFIYKQNAELRSALLSTMAQYEDMKNQYEQKLYDADRTITALHKEMYLKEQGEQRALSQLNDAKGTSQRADVERHQLHMIIQNYSNSERNFNSKIFEIQRQKSELAMQVAKMQGMASQASAMQMQAQTEHEKNMALHKEIEELQGQVHQEEEATVMRDQAAGPASQAAGAESEATMQRLIRERNDARRRLDKSAKIMAELQSRVTELSKENDNLWAKLRESPNGITEGESADAPSQSFLDLLANNRKLQAEIVRLTKENHKLWDDQANSGPAKQEELLEKLDKVRAEKLSLEEEAKSLRESVKKLPSETKELEDIKVAVNKLTADNGRLEAENLKLKEELGQPAQQSRELKEAASKVIEHVVGTAGELDNYLATQVIGQAG